MSSGTVRGIRTLSGNRILVRTPGKRVRVLAPYVSDERVPALLRWLFLLFSFVFPFETAELVFTSGFTSTKTIGVLFAGSYLFYYNPIWSKRSLPAFTPPMWFFLVYLGIAVLNGVLVPRELLREFVSHIFTMVQLVMLFWICSSLLQNQRIAKQSLAAYAIASLILAVGIIFEIPGLSVSVTVEGRVVALGTSPNLLAFIMVPAALIFIGFYLRSTRLNFMIRTSLLVCTLPMLVVLVLSGSRAGVGAFVIGSLMFLIPHRGSRRQLTAMILGIVGVAAIVYLVAQDPQSSERWLLAYHEGDTAGRDKIVAGSLEMIAERPVFGWQPAAAFYELGLRLGLEHAKDAHNLLLYVLLEVGLIGLVPFTIGLLWCCWGAWKGRTGNMGIMPAVILGSVMAFNMTHTGMKHKPTWIFLALGVAVGSVADKKRRNILVKATPRHRYAAAPASRKYPGVDKAPTPDLP